MVEAFVHISEDEIVGLNQRVDTLWERVATEAKARYPSEWVRNAISCKGRFHLISREVQRFIGCNLLVESVPHSGWGENDYYQATVKAYHTSLKKISIDNAIDDIEEVELVFEFKDEWEILRDHEKWRAVLSKPEGDKKESGGSRPFRERWFFE